MTLQFRLLLPVLALLLFAACSAPEQTTTTARKPAFRTDPADRLVYRNQNTTDEAIAFYTTDSTKFAFHAKHEAETNNDVFYWGWNPPFVNYDLTRHTAAFSLERDYQHNIEWNLDVRGSFGPTEQKYQSRPIHAMINAQTGFPKSLDFAFGRIAFYDVRLQMDRRQTEEFAFFSRRENRIAGPLEIGRGLSVKGPLSVNNEYHAVTPGDATLHVNWSTANMHTYDLRREDRCEVYFVHTKIGQTVRIILRADRTVTVDWKSGVLYWRGSKPVTRIGGNQEVTVFKVTRFKLSGVQEAFLIEEEGSYGMGG